MKDRNYYLLIFLFLLSIQGHAQLSVNGYTNYTLSGFDILVQNTAFSTDSSLTHDALDLIESKLTEITQFNIDQEILDSLKAVPIFVDWNTTTGAAVYHPSEAWLRANGYAPEKARCVEISNITNFINWTNQNQPYMVLHELAHAYHHRVLNFNSAIITDAYNHVVANNLYTNVSYHAGGGNYSTQAQAYALNNEKEYFAEITEAYFGLNDYFPFDYDDLSAYDSTGFNATLSIWGDIKMSTSSSKLLKDIVNIYPNPSNGIFTLNFNDHQIQGLSFEVVDKLGTILLSDKISGLTPISIDLSDKPSGLYFLRLIHGKSSQAFKIVKY